MQRLTAFVEANAAGGGDNGVSESFDLNGDGLADLTVQDIENLTVVVGGIEDPQAGDNRVLTNIFDRAPIDIPFAALLLNDSETLTIIGIGAVTGGTAELVDTDGDNEPDAVRFIADESGRGFGIVEYITSDGFNERSATIDIDIQTDDFIRASSADEIIIVDPDISSNQQGLGGNDYVVGGDQR